MAEARVAVVCEKNKEGWTQNRGQQTQPPAHEQGHTVPPRPLLQGSRQSVERNEKHTHTNSTNCSSTRRSSLSETEARKKHAKAITEVLSGKSI